MIGSRFLSASPSIETVRAVQIILPLLFTVSNNGKSDAMPAGSECAAPIMGTRAESPMYISIGWPPVWERESRVADVHLDRMRSVETGRCVQDHGATIGHSRSRLRLGSR